MKPALLLALAMLMGCAAPRPPVRDTLAVVRDCITGGEPSSVEEWRELVLDCTEEEQ